jgi:hypothetical protein
VPKGYPGSVAPHGTPARYGTHGCRCEACLTAWRSRYYPNKRPREVYLAEVKAAAWQRHGTEGRYIRGCKCDECRAAANAARQQRRLTGNVYTHNAAGYSGGCRCDVCRAAHAEYRRQQTAAKKAAA